MLKAKKLNELDAREGQRLALLRRTYELAEAQRERLPPQVFGGTHQIDLHVALVKADFLSVKEFDRLYCPGFYTRALLGAAQRTPEDRKAIHEVRELRELLKREYWAGVEGKRTQGTGGGSLK